MRSKSYMHTLIMGLLLQVEGGGAVNGAVNAAPAAPGDVNSTAVRPDTVEWPEGDLPEQGGARVTLMPGIDVFRLPANLAQLWAEIGIKDTRQFLGNGSNNPTFNQVVLRKKLSLTKNAPLVVVGGHNDGLPMTAVFTTNPRPRGKKDDLKTPWIHDLAFMLESALADKSRPTTPDALVAAVNKYAGHEIRLEHGLSAQCNPEKVRYITVTMPSEKPGGEPTYQSIQDPSGTKGCGSRYYTKDFRDPETGYEDTLECQCGALLRGFESVERFLPPLASTQTVGGTGQPAPVANTTAGPRV